MKETQNPASLLQKLLDFEPELSHDQDVSRAASFSAFCESIRSDLEAFLNTRQWPYAIPGKCAELEKSLLRYGTKGYFGSSLATQGQRLKLAESIKKGIENSDQRLRNVAVDLGENSDDRYLSLKIRAKLYFNGDFHTIKYETALDPTTRHVRVQENVDE